MYHKPLGHKELIKLIVLYAIMTLAVIIIVTFVVLFVLGYRFDTTKGQLEKYAFLQFNSAPAGATVMVDGRDTGTKTPNKKFVPAGSHNVTMELDGYRTWQKTVNTKSGTLVWLNYALFIPQKLKVETVANYGSLHSTLASPDKRYMIIEESYNSPTFVLVDTSSDTIKSTNLTIPSDQYSESSTAGVTHTFQITSWDDGGRYVLVKHGFGDKSEWLTVDTQNTSLTKNITRLFDINIDSIRFSDTSGNVFYALVLNGIRKLNLSAGTISKPLVSDVTSFDISSESNAVLYIGTSNTDASKKVAGIYHDGDDKTRIFRTVASGDELHIAAGHYFNEDYLAVSDNKKVNIWKVNYSSITDDNIYKKAVTSFTAQEDIHNLMFSPAGEYVLVQAGAYFASYDLEYKTFASSTIDGSGDTLPLKWLDNCHIWSDRGGKLTIREYDGQNVNTINNVTFGQDVFLTRNGHYIYSINKTTSGYQLQRAKMIIEQ
jgi:hypothetical protein